MNAMLRAELAGNGAARLTDLVHGTDIDEGEATVIIADYHWAFDVANRITAMGFVSLVGLDGESDYGYDNTNQLLTADHDFQTDEDHEFDLNGNRTDDGHDVDPNNQLASDGTFNYTFDAEGNRLTKVRISIAPADDKTVQYQWDHRNRLSSITYKNNAGIVTRQITYAYDVINRRIEKVVDFDGAGINAAAIERFLHDGDHIVLAIDGDDLITDRYLPGPVIDLMLASEHFDEGLEIGDAEADPGEVRWPLADNLGSVRDIVDNEGDVITHITYNAWGVITSETAPSVAYAFAFTGRERDLESDLEYYRNRYYDAAIGGWISEDPLGFAGDPSNLSRYVFNSPTTAIDPFGLDLVVVSDGFHSGIQVDVWDAAGNHAGVLTIDYQARNWDLNRNSCGSLKAVVGARGEFLLTFYPSRLDPPKGIVDVIEGTPEQDGEFLDWVLAQMGKDRTWLDNKLKEDRLWLARFLGEGKFKWYDLMSTNCNSFVGHAVNAYGEDVFSPQDLDGMSAGKLKDILDGTYVPIVFDVIFL